MILIGTSCFVIGFWSGFVWKDRHRVKEIKEPRLSGDANVKKVAKFIDPLTQRQKFDKADKIDDLLK